MQCESRIGEGLQMKKRTHFFGIALVIILLAALSSAQSGGQQASGSQRMQDRITREARHELVMLPQLTIFDNLQYKVEGSKVTLLGQVRNAILKDEAEKAVKRIEGVEQVENQIEILPASGNDDRLRQAVAHAVFGQD